MAKLAALLAVAAILCGVVLAQQQPQPQPQQQEKQQPEDLPNPEGRTELPVQGRPIRARQRFRPRPVRPQNRVDIVRPRRPAQGAPNRPPAPPQGPANRPQPPNQRPPPGPQRPPPQRPPQGPPRQPPPKRPSGPPAQPESLFDLPQGRPSLPPQNRPRLPLEATPLPPPPPQRRPPPPPPQRRPPPPPQFQPQPRPVRQPQGPPNPSPTGRDRPPFLLEGGDLVDFSLREDTSVGTEVYSLRGRDPEGGRVKYTISGDYFSVDGDTGAVRLREPLDREATDAIDVVITIQDAAFNLIPFRREIRVLDVNDNAPSFLEAPYKFSIKETVAVGDVVFSKMAVADADAGANAAVRIECVVEGEDDGSCDTFDVRAQELSQTGSYVGLISLKRPLDYEARSSYNLALRAVDGGLEGARTSTTNVLVEVEDVQDQKPFFVNAPYSATVPENTPPGSSIFKILVRDGDTGLPRKIDLSLVGDDEGFFSLESSGHDEDGVLTAMLKTAADVVIDRETEAILSEGGLYAFQILAREIADDGSFGDSATTDVTIVVTDQDDEIPRFNMETVKVAVPEDVGPDTPLPDLNLVVDDLDTSRNAEYQLVIEDVANSDGVFSVYPDRAVGRTPVIIRVANPEYLDYESEGGRSFSFRVNAVKDSNVLSSVLVSVIVADSNDNEPHFDFEVYRFAVPEDAPPRALVGQIVATDLDSGRFGQVEYALRGFGADRFDVNSITGEITVKACGLDDSGQRERNCLDYETQTSYALTYTATDGGGQVTTTSAEIDVEDVNDNYPKFELEEYLRVVEEGDTSFRPPLVIQATDSDGPTQGGGRIFYSIHSINTERTAVSIDPISGEIVFVAPASSADTEAGRYDIVVRATDSGKPKPLHRDAKVTVRVGTVNNLRPKFLAPDYETSVTEDARGGAEVARLEAEDPDGRDDELRFHIHSGAKDNFVIDSKSGVLSVAPDANLDIQRSGDTYDIQVRVIDSGKPFSQTGEATVTVFVDDVNDKKPKFERNSYTVYALESTPIGADVLRVTAFDADRDADLEFSIVEPITARDKTGNALTNRAAYDFSSAFAVHPLDGRVVAQEPLSHSSAAVIIVTLKVEDKNAAPGYENQTDTAEATFYIQAYKADSPQFSSPWTPGDPTLTFDVKEEQPVGTVLFKLNAKDPVTGQAISHFEKLPDSDPENLIDVSPVTGEVINSGALDYETRRQVEVGVRARTQEGDRFSDARVVVRLKDINDNAPVFEQQEYAIDVPESVFPMTELLTVRAVDVDAEADFGSVRYAVRGEGEDTFVVDPVEGQLMLKSGPGGRSNLDRERQDFYTLNVVATDMPDGGAGQRSSSAMVHVRVVDVNDSPPRFSESRYSAVVPENSDPGTLVLRVEATDPDLGESGRVRFAFPEGSRNDGFYRIVAETGEVFTVAELTGKGRQAPYVLTVRAIDNGEESQLFTDTEVYITVGDVSSNDGVPDFERPKVDEVAYVAENATAGTKVFQVVAHDPDDPNTSNGKIVYTLPDDGTIIRKLFQLDPGSGVLSTKVRLDREERDEYTLILTASDLGSPPQQTSRLLKVVVKDIDDHKPAFNRQRNSVPMEIEVKEEIPLGSRIGEVAAVDADEGDNAVIEYAIVDGNDDRVFAIERGPSNEGVVTLARRLDRETSGVHLLTIKCFRPYERNVKSGLKAYDSNQRDEIQVKVVVRDIDDNSPIFRQHNTTTGVRVNAPLYTVIETLTAVDADVDSSAVFYQIKNVTFYRPRTNSREIMDNDVFIIDPSSGILQTNRTLGQFADGYFNLVFRASNGPGDKKRGDFTTLKVYVLQDTELMKFVFDLDPTSTQKRLPDFKEALETALRPQPLRFHLYDTEFYSQVDGSLDFGRTSSCFQVVSDESVVDQEMSERLLDFSERPELKRLLDQYDVVKVERCASIKPTERVDWVEICLLAIALLVGVLSFVAAIAVCCLYSNYKQSLRRSAPVKIIEAPVRTYIPTSLPPGSVRAGPVAGNAPSIAGSDGRILYDWQESTIPMDAQSYRSMPNQ